MNINVTSRPLGFLRVYVFVELPHIISYSCGVRSRGWRDGSRVEAFAGSSIVWPRKISSNSLYLTTPSYAKRGSIFGEMSFWDENIWSHELKFEQHSCSVAVRRFRVVWIAVMRRVMRRGYRPTFSFDPAVLEQTTPEELIFKLSPFKRNTTHSEWSNWIKLNFCGCVHRWVEARLQA
jgi:hypothetical protein